MYFKVFLSTLSVGAATLAEYRRAIYEITRVWPSSITLNDQKRCLCVYFEDPVPWLKLLREYLIVVTPGMRPSISLYKCAQSHHSPENPPKPAVVLRCVPSFAATTSLKWCKFFIGNLPDNVNEEKLYKFFERIGMNSSNIWSSNIAQKLSLSLLVYFEMQIPTRSITLGLPSLSILPMPLHLGSWVRVVSPLNAVSSRLKMQQVGAAPPLTKVNNFHLFSKLLVNNLLNFSPPPLELVRLTSKTESALLVGYVCCSSFSTIMYIFSCTEVSKIYNV